MDNTTNYTVFYQCRSGSGISVWETTDNRAEAIAHRNWCFADPSLQPTMVWVLDSDGHVVDSVISGTP